MLTQYSITRNLGRLFGFVALLAAFTVSSHAQVLAHSGDASAHYGYGFGNYSTSGVGATNNHQEFGFSGGVNASSSLSFIGEYSYMPMGTYSGVDFKTQLFGGGVRFNFGDSGKVVPYALTVRPVETDLPEVRGGGVSVSATGAYAAFGGGVSCYLGKNWGIRPEFRYERQFLSFSGITSDTPVFSRGRAASSFNLAGSRNQPSTQLQARSGNSE